jgi:hypothetical protein
VVLHGDFGELRNVEIKISSASKLDPHDDKHLAGEVYATLWDGKGESDFRVLKEQLERAVTSLSH